MELERYERYYMKSQLPGVKSPKKSTQNVPDRNSPLKYLIE